MDIEEFRKYCLSFPGVTEKMPWTHQPEYENLLVFSVGNKWFAFVDVKKFDFCDLKSLPERAADLRKRYDGIVPGWHMNHDHWISVYFNRDVPDGLIRRLVEEAYHDVYNSLSLKERQAIS